VAFLFPFFYYFGEKCQQSESLGIFLIPSFNSFKLNVAEHLFLPLTGFFFIRLEWNKNESFEEEETLLLITNSLKFCLL
jgi:hypothetical protein